MALSLKQKQVDDQRGSSSRVGQQNWNFVWKLKVPKKVKHFIWRALHNSLPTFVELEHRRITPQTLCAVCGHEGESTLYILCDFHFARQYWALAPCHVFAIYLKQHTLGAG